MLIDLLLLVLLFYSLYGCSINKNALNDNLTLSNANSLKAIFAIIVVFCHLTNYIETGKIFWIFDSLGTFAVSIFLFISGYGLMKQYMVNNDYSNKIIGKRVPSIVKSFLFVSILYIIYYLIIGVSINELFNRIINMFITGDSIVSNSWYVYLNIELYLLFYITIKLFDRKYNYILIFVTSFCLIQMIIMKQFNFCMCWYVTTFNFAFGIIYSYFEKEIFNHIVKDYNYLYIAFIIILSLLFYINITNPLISDNLLFYIVKYVIFAICVLLVTYKIDLHNRMLFFIHSISYELYLVHGLVILILSNYINNDFSLCISCVLFSIVLAFIMNKINKLIVK